MDRVPAVPGQPELVVDYAHTPDALDKALGALRPLAAARGGALWCVFGCGGNRDASKRPLMGEIAARLADRVVVTSDNPRRENAHAILDQIVTGVPHAAAISKLQVEGDRRLAILQTVAAAAASDVHFTTDRVIICSCLKKVPWPCPPERTCVPKAMMTASAYLYIQGKH